MTAPTQSGAGHLPPSLIPPAASVKRSTLKTSTTTLSGTGGGIVTVVMGPYSFHPDVKTDSGGQVSIDALTPNALPLPDTPTFTLNTVAGGVAWDVAWRSVDA